MKILLRSMFLSSPTDDGEMIFRNYLAFVDSGLGFDNLQDTAIFEYIRSFATSHNHCPNINSIRAHFKSLKENEVLDRVAILEAENPIVKGDFLVRLEDNANTRRILKLKETLRTAEHILTDGVEIRGDRKSDTRILRGPFDTVKYLMDQSHAIVVPTTGAKLSGEVTSDGIEMLAEYQRIKANPMAGLGQFTGIQNIDLIAKGAKRFELWLHAAFTGHGKSTLMLNWAYNQAIFFRYDATIFSLEMPYTQCRRILYAMHSMHPKFKDIRIKLGIQKDPRVTTGLEYGKIRDGILSETEELFFEQYVIPDMMSPEYGKIFIEVAPPDKSDFTVVDLRARAELMYKRNPFQLLFVDHALLMAPSRKMGNTTENINQVLRDLKKLAMGFNRGEGMAVVALFQISREGFKSAEKNGGMYNLTHLSYANEAERSSDVVTASYIDDDMRRNGTIHFQNLKSRDNELFDPFLCQINWQTRRLLSSADFRLTDQKKAEFGDKLDGILDL